MEAKVIVTTELQLKAFIADAVSAAFKYHQPSIPASPAPDDETPLSVSQAAVFLGISTQTVYQRIKKIPHRKRFGRLYFYASDLRAYIDGGEGVDNE